MEVRIKLDDLEKHFSSMVSSYLLQRGMVIPIEKMSDFDFEVDEDSLKVTVILHVKDSVCETVEKFSDEQMNLHVNEQELQELKQ